MGEPLPLSRGVESFGIEVVDPTRMEVVDRLRVVHGTGSIRWQLDGQATLTAEVKGPLPQLVGRLLRPVYTYAGGSMALGLFALVLAPEQIDSAGRTYDLQAADLTVLLGRATLAKAVTLPRATDIAATLPERVGEVHGWIPLAVLDLDRTTRIDATWEAGATELDIATELAEAAGYRPLHPDLDGTLHSGPWEEPGERVSTLTFADRMATGVAPFEPTVSGTDRPARPNHVIVVFPGDADVPGVVGRWVDDDPWSPGSIPNIGEFPHVVRADAPASQDAANVAAHQEALKVRAEGRTDSWSGPWQPVLPGDIVDLDYASQGLSGRRELTAVSIDFRPGSNATYSGREV